MSALPIPSAEAQQYSQQLCDSVQQRIVQSNGWVSFSEFMHMALYAPALGYYSGGAQKFGNMQSGGGDFVTAPEITPLFSQALARQVSQVLALTQGDVLELGAGTGKLAGDLILALAELNQLPSQYFILEVSSHLRAVQHEALQSKLPSALFSKLVWLNELPNNFDGLILGNEVLDAIPVYLIAKKEGALYERGVAFEDGFIWQDQPLQDPSILKFVETEAWPNDYLTEVCPAAIGLISSLANTLSHGAIVMLDYGFSAQAYYHPQRNQGTLMCHYQHYAHSDPLIHVGLQDITAHVNFTAIAEAGLAQGLELYGYSNQAQFLMNCGLLDLLEKESPDDALQYVPMAAAVQKLLSPAEMGELFKVIAFTKDLDAKGLGDDAESALIGFTSGDKAHTL
ncbi:MAG: class I SAM-dependent methyltransferase [Methylophilaceae bacterium]